MTDWIGWLATALIVSSYFSKQPATLRRVQAVAALAWAVYGALIHSLPVLVANVIVMSAAVWTSFRQPRATPV
ncbi:MAG TPA: YgjV family protein [Gemmatimonadales bacterium]|nr:YgjV family protein [Gemmatimonadales bacterium]